MFGTLNNQQISEAIKEGDIGIKPFNEEALQASSYDIAIAGQVELRANGEYKAHPESEVIESHHFVAFVSQEYVSLSNGILGHIYMRSRYARLGLLPVNEGRIEVGWKGQLILEFYNATNEPITVKPGDRLVTIEFVRLSEKPSQGYHGIFQNQTFKEYQPLEWSNIVTKIENMVLTDGRLKSIDQTSETRSIASSFLSNLRWTTILQQNDETIILGYSYSIVENTGLTFEAEKIIQNIIEDAVNKVTHKRMTVTLRPI
jgi:dCTP deaminase